MENEIRDREGAGEVKTELAKTMINRADTDNLPLDHEVRIAARLFEDATQGYFADPQTVSVKKYLGQWARTKRIWSDYSGQPLV